MNAISVIKPYKWNGMWVFDDPAKGLDKEPLIAGTDVIISKAVSQLGIPDADKGIVLIFSGQQFPTAQFKAVWMRTEMGGNVYCCMGLEGWLCPALLKYFDKAPEVIYFEIRPAEGK